MSKQALPHAFLFCHSNCSLQSLSDRLAGPLRLIYLPQATRPGFFPVLNCCVSKKLLILIYTKVIGYLFFDKIQCYYRVVQSLHISQVKVNSQVSISGTRCA